MTGNPVRVLVVDDDPDQTEMVARVLTRRGFVVEAANSPFGVSNKARSFNPDLIILDVNIPALSGDQLVGLIRKNSQLDNTRIILFSAMDEDEETSDSRDRSAPTAASRRTSTATTSPRRSAPSCADLLGARISLRRERPRATSGAVAVRRGAIGGRPLGSRSRRPRALGSSDSRRRQALARSPPVFASAPRSRRS